ncbi:ferrous iron transport protein A [Thermosyntropha lipolytica DSM 11003]|uniref:Ferrous iron transport protein A n=1 Tax=Thermosyntropha lipolytica DSM 11003 TaxID=1123382 RepID=A0A1M5LQ08_9FIRM|nr:FeoA family protein [Thermosyntropha lipolytica]SHG67167.1 ferrous iron transport protein A [Thermosyntropha lipolytica DSM 11003]
MARTLKDLMPGERAKVAKVEGRGAVRRRIMDMGLVPGVEVEVERYAPLGDPLEIKIKGYHLSLRLEEAAYVMVEEGGDNA